MIQAFKNTAISLGKALINIIIPPFCQACRTFLEEDQIFCEPCMERIQPIATYQLEVTPTLRCNVWAISDYKEPLKSLLLAKTFSNIVAARQLGHLMWHMTVVNQNPVDVIVPIPLHWQREAKRGYNQAYEMAHVLAQYKQVPCSKLLKRVAKTQYQAHVSFQERQHNVKNVFTLTRLDPSNYHNKHILLVDDLMTSGSTLKEAVKVLARLKPASISIVVACRVAR
ncbi:competence protein ComF [Candidatus Dependentiae bacterium Noda2021]|nr:competence protein ComF [Candidatus Dependentiae bacterium Noda2021]